MLYHEAEARERENAAKAKREAETKRFMEREAEGRRLQAQAEAEAAAEARAAENTELAARERLATEYDRQLRLGLIDPAETPRKLYIDASVSSTAKELADVVKAAVSESMAKGWRYDADNLLALAVQHPELDGADLAGMARHG
jgi:hypothetical protein